ncbi:MAG: ATP-binding cassette domain-containing protein [Eggerthellaceae bacterium]|nr:ATP-binding cassette domain-containing protein [Eggerthellaceae bacterium]
MIEITDLTFRYRESEEPTVHDINLRIPSGTFVGITGPAGSGKSTLTYLMNGIAPHCYPGDFYGSVLVEGLDTCEVSLTDISALVGSVCQDIDSQMVTGNVEDEILFGLENFAVPKEEVEARLVEALSDVGILELRDRAIAGLSGGQKQKVAIASVIALKPKILVLDEPTAELDPASSVGVFEMLRRYAREHGTTVIVVEQKIALLSDYADTLIVMRDGRIALQGSPEEVLAKSDELQRIGVACPRSTSLYLALSRAGFYGGPVCRNVDEAVAMCKEVYA